MGRKKSKAADGVGNVRKGTPLYSHEDIREQYCINKKELEALEKARRSRGIFGCLSSRKENPCKKRTSFFALCVRRGSDENLQNFPNKPVSNTSRSATLPSLRQHAGQRDSDCHEQPMFKSRPQSFCTGDPKRFSTLPSQAHSTISVAEDQWDPTKKSCNRLFSNSSMEDGSQRPFHYGGRLAYTQPNTPELSVAMRRRNTMSPELTRDERREKHVSFGASSPTNDCSSAIASNNSQERLLDGRKTPELLLNENKKTSDSSTFSPILARAILLEKLRQASMRSQATQTEEPYNSCVVSTTSLSYPVSYLSSESISTQTKEIQTNLEPQQRGRLVKSYSEADNWYGQDDFGSAEEFPPPRSRSQEMSKTRQDDETGDAGGSPASMRKSSLKSQSRRKQLLKALSEGAILLDRRRALNFATGYVEVDVNDSDRQSREEAPLARVMVHDLYGGGPCLITDGKDLIPSSSEEEETSLETPDVPVISTTHGFPMQTTEPMAWSDSEYPRTIQTEARNPKLASLALPSQKSFDSTGSLPDTPGNHSDEFGSMSQVTVLHRVQGSRGSASPNSSAGNYALSDSERQSTTKSIVGEEDSEKEIMVQFPPWPQADDVIPAPPNFASSPPPCVSSNPVTSAGNIQEGSHPVTRFRAPLKELQERSKSLSETITSVESDSEHRVTEHETSQSSSSKSEASELPSPEDAAGKVEDSVGSSEAFVTAFSDNAETATSYQTAIERSFSDLSRNSTLRTEFSYEENPPPFVHEFVNIPEYPPTSNDEAKVVQSQRSAEVDSDQSSSSGSYSLGTQPLDPAASYVTEKPDCQTVADGSIPPSELPVRRKQGNRKPQESDKRFTKYFTAGIEDSLQDDSKPVILNDSFDPPRDFKSVDDGNSAEVLARTEKVKLKESLKLQFPPGTTMFTHGEPGSTQPEKPARRRATKVQHESSPSDDEVNSEKRHRKRKSRTAEEIPQKTDRTSKDKDSRAREMFTPALENRNFTVAEVVRCKEQDARQLSPGMVRSPAMHEGFRAEDWVVQRTELLRDPEEGSTKDPAPKSADPTVLVHQASECNEEETRSCPTSPQWLAPDAVKIQALSCESLRSISPGSDSVFVSDVVDTKNANEVFKPPDGFADSPVTSNPPLNDTHETGTKDGATNSLDNGNKKKRDSGRGKRAKSCSLPITDCTAVKSDGEQTNEWSSTGIAVNKAISTSEMWYPETHLPPSRQLTVRAKSEERDRGIRLARRQLARSVDASWESLGSRTSCDGTPLDDEDEGIYDASYRNSAWIYIGETEELRVWQRPMQQVLASRDGDDASTSSEKEFRRKYTAITHRMVHRKSSVEMYRRLATGTFDAHHETGEGSVRQVLEDVYQLMLVIWCRENHAIKLLSSVRSACDEVVLIKKESGEFGFRIHGSRPVVVSAIEPDTPAEESGLQVGDIIIAINGVNVLDASHSEAVRIAHTGSAELKLEIARTCHVLALGSAVDDPSTSSPIMAGYLWKKSQSLIKSKEEYDASAIWCRRWFCLRQDNCLYYYKNDSASQPLGAIALLHYVTSRPELPDRNFALTLSKGGIARHYLAAETEDSAQQWDAALNQAAASAVQHDTWLTVCARNALLPPADLGKPDCVGFLMKLGHRAKAWQRRFCLLKDACLFFYVDTNATSSLGVLHLHGYRVQSTGTTASFERRKFAFELLPPEPRMRHFHFYTDSDNDRKRWIAALEYSIDRWVRIG